MKKFFKQKNTENSGFTLVETLVALSIFTTSILALLSVLTGGISNTSYAKEKIVGAYLAQEGIEYIRNMRDTFVLYNGTNGQTGWNDFNSKLITASCQNANGCYFNDQNLSYADPSQPITKITLAPCNASCPQLLYDSNTGKYGYGSGVNSLFSRKIQVSVVSSDEIKVSSTVSWVQGSGVYSMSFSENLFNWQDSWATGFGG